MKRTDFIENWLDALESGEYKQVRGKLWNYDQENPKYCCLGVACDVANELGIRKLDLDDADDWNEMLPKSMAKFMGIQVDGHFIESIRHRGKRYITLTGLNDSGVKFKTIARIIREQLAAKNFEKFGA